MDCIRISRFDNSASGRTRVMSDRSRRAGSVLIVLVGLHVCHPCHGGEEGPLLGSELAAEFREPAARRRVLQIIHNFPDRPSAIESRVRTLAERGFGGVVANVSFDDYLRSDEKWRAFRAGVQAVEAAGLAFWLYDEQGYPSAAAGGLTLEGHPEWEARGLLCVVAESDGRSPLELKLPGGVVVLAAAYAVRDGVGDLSRTVDLREQIAGGRSVRWDRPGRWRICAFVESRLREGTHAMANLYRKRPYPNLLQREPTERFIELTHEEYARRFESLREHFEAIFTDEPSLMSVFLEPAPYPALPWAPGLPEAFRRATGRDLVPLLPALVADFGSGGRRIRCEFWKVIGQEVAANYFGQIQEWCRAHGIASTGHLLAEEDLGSHVGFYGNFYRCASRLDIPGIDCLTSVPATVPWHVAKLLGSVRCLHGRAQAMSETSDHAQRYRAPGDDRPVRNVTAAEVLGTTHLLYVAGITTTTSYYSWAGLDDDSVRRVNEHVGRLGTILAGAQHVSDVAVLYPVESAWDQFVPQRMRASAPGVARIDGVYRGVLTELFHRGCDFDVIEARAIGESRIKDGALAVGSERYRVLVLPAAGVLPLVALRRARELVVRGGSVVAVGDLPVNTPDQFPDEQALGIVRELFGTEAVAGERAARRMVIMTHPGGGRAVYLPEGSAWSLGGVIDGLIEPDVSFADGLPLRASHWRRESAHVYFVINDSTEAVEAPVAFRARGTAELWDPASGEVAALMPREDGRIMVDLPAYGAAFLVFAGARVPRSVADRGVPESVVEAISLLEAPTPRPRVLLHAPPHVDRGLLPLAEPESAGEAKEGGESIVPPLRVTARLVEGDVDSWCFLELSYPELVDLGSFRALEFLVRTPRTQAGCGASCYVLLLEENEDGSVADYIADAHRGMGLPGLRRTTLGLRSFQLAGWSSDPDGKLDLSRVRSIRVGWGGYHGAKGETITFDLEEVNGLRFGPAPEPAAEGSR